MKHFKENMTFEEAKSLYRELLLKNHPDKGGNNEICAEIINEYKSFINTILQKNCDDIQKEKGFTPKTDIGNLSEILSKISTFNMTIEIIGT